MKKLIYNALAMFSLVTSLSCDKIPLETIQKKPLPVLKCTDPIKIVNQSDTTVLVKKIYLEYFTGHLCGNCPESSGAAFSQIEAAFPSKVIVSKIHSNFFARIQKPKYTTDLTYAGGNKLYATYNTTNAVPTGMVDRAKYNNNIVMSPSEWINAVKVRDNVAPTIQLTLNTEYCESARSLLVNASMKFVKPYGAAISVNGYISENNIVSMQYDYSRPEGSRDVPDFVHKYVLREDLSVSESSASASSYTRGTSLVTTFAANLKSTWNEKECYVIVLVSDQKTGEVLQVEQLKIYSKK